MSACNRNCLISLALRIYKHIRRNLLSINENLEKLSNACGVTGRETEVRELMIRLMTPYADEIVVDKLENVIADQKRKTKNA